jgi:3'(2'), 5'-bisphosphate nucleotidase
MIDRHDVLSKLLAAAAAAAEPVMRVYGAMDVGISYKGPDDPVTRADEEANALLLELLHRDFPGVPIVAEESDPSSYAGFGSAPHALFVDPVDGTRDFIAKNGEFAIMLGFAEAGEAKVGVVECPALGERYGAIVGTGAFRITAEGRTPIHVSDNSELAHARCAVSRFHRSEAVDTKLAALGPLTLVPTGSAGIKGVRVASGALDIYAHPSNSAVKLWDACAPEAIVRAAGGIWTDCRGRAFDYRGPFAQNNGTLAANPTLHAEARRRFSAVGV